MAETTTSAVLRRAETLSRTGLPESTLYRLMANGQFPRQLKLGPRAVGWLESEVNAWIAERAAERDRAAVA